MDAQKQLRRVEIREILLRHRGMIAHTAVALGLKVGTVSAWIHGRFKSQRIAEALQKKALELLEQERTDAEAAGKDQ